MNTVHLTFFEFFNAATAGVLRNMEARKNARGDNHGRDLVAGDGGWGVHIEGACAEMAVAKFFGLYWDPVWRALDRQRGDVAGYQVRSTMRRNGCLLLHHQDQDDAVFLLVVGVAPSLTIVGSILGRDGKRPEFWREDTGRPAFFVPQSALKPVERERVAA